MAVSVKEAKSDTSARPTPTVEQKLYSMDEQMILAKMETFMNGKPFHHLDIDTSIPTDVKVRRKEIIATLTRVVTDIRLKKKPESALFDYQNAHFEDVDHVWLQELHPGLNVNGWRVFMAEMDPLKYGKNIDRPLQNVRGTITNRSAKS